MQLLHCYPSIRYFVNRHDDGDEEELELYEVKAGIQLFKTFSEKTAKDATTSNEDNDVVMGEREDSDVEEEEFDDEEEGEEDSDDAADGGPAEWDSDASSQDEEDEKEQQSQSDIEFAEENDLLDTSEWVEDLRPKCDAIVAHLVKTKAEWSDILSAKNTVVVKNGTFTHLKFPTPEEKEVQLQLQAEKEARAEARKKGKKRGPKAASKKTTTAPTKNTVALPDTEVKEERFLVKWKGYSYIHCTWELRDTIETLLYNSQGKRRLTTYWTKHEEGLTQPFTYGYVRCFNPLFNVPERMLDVIRSDNRKETETASSTTSTLNVASFPATHPNTGDAFSTWSTETTSIVGGQARIYLPDITPVVDGVLALSGGVIDGTIIARTTTTTVTNTAPRLSGGSPRKVSTSSSSSSSSTSSTSSTASESTTTTNQFYLFQSIDLNEKPILFDENQTKMALFCFKESLLAVTIKWNEQDYVDITVETPSDLNHADLSTLLASYDKRCTPPENRKDLGKALKNPYRLSKHDLKDGGELQETYTEEDNQFKDGNKLRHYQLSGVNWMLWNWKNQRNSILADEMGLGKTVQSVMYCNHLWENERISSKVSLKKQRNVGQFLIVAPLSVVPHWKREFDAWTEMNAVVYHGSAKSRELIERYETSYDEWDNISVTNKGKKKSKRDMTVCKFDVVITTYEMCHKDAEFFRSVPWRILVVDEAHKLKNDQSQLSLMLRSINRNATLLLTGTPLQNDTKELWSLLNFLDHKKFPRVEDFLDDCGEVTDAEGLGKLHDMLGPYMLRRMKEDVEKSLQAKQEMIIQVELTSEQKRLYRAVYEKNVSQIAALAGERKGEGQLRNIAMQLRKCCNHPFLINGVEEQTNQKAIANAKPGEDPMGREAVYGRLIAASGKLVLLDKLLPKLRSDGHRVLIFSQFVMVLDILNDYLTYRGFKFERLDGGTFQKKMFFFQVESILCHY